jgi:ABC-type nitrate/sulfonate/bicarbonate transport system permease component
MPARFPSGPEGDPRSAVPPRMRLPWIGERAWYGVAGVVVFLVLWETVSRAQLVKSVLISSPTSVVATAIDQVATGAIWPNLWATLSVWAVGFVLAAILGIGLGMLSGRFKRARYIADSWLNFTNVAPDLAFVPILILWFGIGVTFKVVLVVLTGTFYVAINTLAGVKSAEGRFLQVATSFGASELTTLRTVILPGSIPYIITGLRQASARTIVAVIVAEFVSANQGIGFMISVSGSFLDTSKVMFGIAILAGMSLAVSQILGRIEREFDSWRPVSR